MTDNNKISRIVDDESKLVILEGASLSQLGSIFNMDSRDITNRIAGRVKPCGKRGGFSVYKIKEVAAYLSGPLSTLDVDDLIKRMTTADLPTAVTKEFWAAMRSRQLYEKEAAELWPTSHVVDTVSDLFKTIRMSMLLTRESVERETELTERQRAIIINIIDNALESAHAAIATRFAEVAKRQSSDAENSSEDF